MATRGLRSITSTRAMYSLSVFSFTSLQRWKTLQASIKRVKSTTEKDWFKPVWCVWSSEVTQTISLWCLIWCSSSKKTTDRLSLNLPKSLCSARWARLIKVSPCREMRITSVGGHKPSGQIVGIHCRFRPSQLTATKGQTAQLPCSTHRQRQTIWTISI